MVKDALKKTPSWATHLLLAVTMVISGWWVRDTLDENKQQSADIRELSSTVHDLATIVEYNYKEVERNSADVKELRGTQQRLEVLLARVEAQLDKDAQS